MLCRHRRAVYPDDSDEEPRQTKKAVKTAKPMPAAAPPAPAPPLSALDRTLRIATSSESLSHPPPAPPTVNSRPSSALAVPSTTSPSSSPPQPTNAVNPGPSSTPRTVPSSLKSRSETSGVSGIFLLYHL